MNTLFVVYANSGDGWAMEDSTPARRLYFIGGSDVHDYSLSHDCIMHYLAWEDFPKKEVALFGENLPLDADLNWPTWWKDRDERWREYQMRRDDPYGMMDDYDLNEDVDELARDEDGTLITPSEAARRKRLDAEAEAIMAEHGAVNLNALHMVTVHPEPKPPIPIRRKRTKKT